MKGSKSPISGLVVAGSMNFGPGVEAAVLSGAWAAEALRPGPAQGRGRKGAGRCGTGAGERAGVRMNGC